MNRSAAYAALDEETGAYFGWFRPVWKAEAIPVCEDGRPKPFQNMKDAEIAAWRAKDLVEQPVMYRDGATLSSGPRAAAEAHFKTAEVR